MTPVDVAEADSVEYGSTGDDVNCVVDVVVAVAVALVAD